MASKLGKVLDIEAVDFYIKKPVGPMVTIEVRDISKLVGYIRIPSMAEGASATDTIRQKGFSIQAFRTNAGSVANLVTMPESITQIESNLGKGQPTTTPPSANTGKAPNSRPTPQGATRANKSGPPTKTPPNFQATGSGTTRAEAKISMNRPLAPT
jgi:hypothetical protein